VEKLLTKNMFKNQKAFMYAVYKQQYLELLEKQEYQRVQHARTLIAVHHRQNRRQWSDATLAHRMHRLCTHVGFARQSCTWRF
jgi:hypothetical protein